MFELKTHADKKKQGAKYSVAVEMELSGVVVGYIAPIKKNTNKTNYSNNLFQSVVIMRQNLLLSLHSFEKHL